MRKHLIVAALAVISGPGWASCDQAVKANDAMQFDVKEITVDKTCKRFTIKLEHTGKLPKTAMGHNWVLTSDADFQRVATGGVSAGAARDYVPDDAAVIAHSKVLGGGESATVSIDVARLAAGKVYTFFCSFPGHWAMMKGTLKLGS
ncbi:azurin [Paraburkholderia atlantica]|uniref:Azurin n=1 Tax=Paraburkholderia atlantica TaxID=2654982 RepID=D5WI73_PARAM|nr:azurin [Paraburkholderia atlantica]ADG18168.1 azurin [Paraburkholderia atlantica]